MLVYICQSQSPNSSHHHHSRPPLPPLGIHTFVLYVCVSISALQKKWFICTIFLDSTYVH